MYNFMNAEQLFEVLDLVKELLHEYKLFYTNPTYMTVRSNYVITGKALDSSRNQEIDIVNETHPDAVTCAHFEIGLSQHDIDNFPTKNVEKVFGVDIMTFDTSGSIVLTGGWYRTFAGDFEWDATRPVRHFDNIESVSKLIAEQALDFLTD